MVKQSLKQNFLYLDIKTKEERLENIDKQIFDLRLLKTKYLNQIKELKKEVEE